MAAGDTEAAIADFNVAVARSPRNPRAYLARGRAYEAQGRVESALASYTRVVELAAGTPMGDEAEQRIAGELPPSGADTSAPASSGPPPKGPRPPTRTAIARADAGVAKARTAIENKNYDEAVALLDDAVRSDRDRYEAWMLLGDAQLKRESPALAIVAYQRSVSLAPRRAAPFWGIARAYDALGEKQSAKQYYRLYAASVAPDVDDKKRDLAAMITEGYDPDRPWVAR